MKNELQQKLLLLNRNGSTAKVMDEGVEVTQTLVDSFIVTRVEGEVFWLLWKSRGFIEGPQYAHTVKVVNIDLQDVLDTKHDGEQWTRFKLTDDRGWEIQVDLIEPNCEVDKAQAWKEWTAYRNKNAERFALADKQVLEDHTRIAMEWS